MTEFDERAEAGQPRRIFLIPAHEKQTSNPYTSIVADQLARRGCTVLSPSVRQRFLSRADIVHIHWPQNVIVRDVSRSWLGIVLRLAFLVRQKLAGAKLVWTTHNVVSHEGFHPRLERAYMGLFVRLLTGSISLSGHDRQLAIEAFPRLRNLPCTTIPHSIYGDWYPPATALHSRDRSDRSARTISFLGDIKPYKDLDALLAALASGVPDGHRYRIWGKCAEPALSASYRSRIGELQQAGWDIEWAARRLGNQDLSNALAATDLLVLPYRRGENSGMAILAAEHGVPLLMSDVSAFRALYDEIGSGHARICEGPFSHQAITESLAHFGQLPRVTPQSFIHGRSHAATGSMTIQFYRKLWLPKRRPIALLGRLGRPILDED